MNITQPLERLTAVCKQQCFRCLLCVLCVLCEDRWGWIMDHSHSQRPCSAADGLSQSDSLRNLLSSQPPHSITPNTYVNTEPPLPSTTADRQQTPSVNNVPLSTRRWIVFLSSLLHHHREITVSSSWKTRQNNYFTSKWRDGRLGNHFCSADALFFQRIKKSVTLSAVFREHLFAFSPHLVPNVTGLLASTNLLLGSAVSQNQARVECAFHKNMKMTLNINNSQAIVCFNLP